MERPNARGANTLIVGIFVFISLLVGAGFVVFMGGSSVFGKEIKIRTHFADVRGLNVGAPVLLLSGIQVGRVAAVEYPEIKAGSEGGVDVFMNLFSQYRDRVRKDSEASISTQGVLGDKVMILSPGSFNSEMVSGGDTVASHREPELSDYFAKGAGIVEGLSDLTKNLNLFIQDIRAGGHLKSTLASLDRISATLAVSSKEDIGPVLKSLHHILAKVDRGEGTLGALINDSSLHEDLRAVLGGAKRSQVVRFLVRQAIAGNEKEEVPAAVKKKGK